MSFIKFTNPQDAINFVLAKGRARPQVKQSLVKQDNIDFIIKNPSRKLKVDDKEYDNVIGSKTEGGFYKNGYESKMIKDNFLQINIITSRWSIITIEEKFMINIKNKKVVRHKGFDNVDLMNLGDDNGELVNETIEYFKNKKE